MVLKQIASVDLSYSVCPHCNARWREARPFCPRCGAEEALRRDADGLGIVAAITKVMRPPSADLVGPYTICLVDMAEGFRVMGHGADDVAVGSSVTARVVQFAGASVPFFENVR